MSKDIEATIGAMTALGAKFTVDGGDITVIGSGSRKAEKCVIDCNESGSTLRFIIPIAAALGSDTEFRGRGRLPQRPIDIFIRELGKNGVAFDYHNTAHVARAMEMARELHSSGVTSKWSFDIFENTAGILKLLNNDEKARYNDFERIRTRIEGLEGRVRATSGAPVLCHNDFYDPNFLVRGSDISLIDWEYAGMSDYASDLGTFICCSDYSYEEAIAVLSKYFQREPTSEELFHCISYVAFAAWYWFVWALYKDQCGDPVGDWQDLWHRYASEYGRRAEQLASEA